MCIRDSTNVESYDNSKKSFGSGFFINNEGYFLTNHHTIDNCSLVEVNTGNMNYEAMIISEDKINDIAIGRIDIETNPSLKMSNDKITLGEKIIVAGFPLSGK